MMLPLGGLADKVMHIVMWCAWGAGGFVLLALAFVLWNLRLLVLRYRLGKFFDGGGLATVYRHDGPTGTVHIRPRIWGRKTTLWGYRFYIRTANGLTWEDLTEQANALAQHLKVAEVKIEPTERPGCAIVSAYTRDPAPESFSLSNFLSTKEMDLNQSTGVAGVPIGRKDDGSTFKVSLGHTLIVGATGSGKGSLLWTYLIGAQSLLANQGLKLYGWDPKHAELAGVKGERFERIAFDPGEGLALLQVLVIEMRNRQALGLRSFTPGPQMPFILLVIDEFNSLMTSADAAWRKDVRENLHALLSQGRSAGIYIVAAAQQPQKESIGDYRQHFMNRICLRVETAIETDMVLGAGSVEAGAKSHLIAPATESNGYRTAGIGYARSDSEPIPVRFRAPKVTDDDILTWCAGKDSNE